MPASRLSPKEARFVAEYLIDGNGTRAAIIAGYSEVSASTLASRVLRKPHVAHAVTKGQRRQAMTAEVTAERITAELAKIAFGNIGAYFDISSGEPVLTFTDVNSDEMGNIQEITTDTITSDDDTIKRVKVKMYDKRAALNDLARIKGMLKDNLSLTGKDGEALAPMVFAKVKPVKPDDDG